MWINNTHHTIEKLESRKWRALGFVFCLFVLVEENASGHIKKIILSNIPSGFTITFLENKIEKAIKFYKYTYTLNQQPYVWEFIMKPKPPLAKNKCLLLFAVAALL